MINLLYSMCALPAQTVLTAPESCLEMQNLSPTLALLPGKGHFNKIASEAYLFQV